MTSLLEGRGAIVTGASRGIGMAAAHAFAEAGAAVVLAARSAEALDAVAGRITEGGGRALAVATDMTDPAAVERTAAIDYGRRNIRVNALAPGPIENEQMAASLTDERRNLIAGRLPMGRLGRTDEVARAAVWLCSDEASFITGAVLSIDGGRLAGGA